MSAPNGLVLFNYPLSPFGRRITWYLALRGIQYAECPQPIYLPRPDLEALGVQYRRIPLLFIGRSAYCDSRLILEKLETLFPELPRLSATSPDQLAIQKLLEIWTVDSGVFSRVTQLLPTDSPFMKDPKFIKDREDYAGRSWAPEVFDALRPEALSHVRQALDILENGFLADGRQWILKTEKPSLADIEAIWPFTSVLSQPGRVPANLISKETHPRVFAYIDRFLKATEAASTRLGKAIRLNGPDAINHITQADFPDDPVSMTIDQNDPLAAALAEGRLVASGPIDTGTRHQDVGKLVKLSKQELVLEVEGKEGREGVRVHHPRWNFRAKAVDGSKL